MVTTTFLDYVDPYNTPKMALYAGQPNSSAVG